MLFASHHSRGISLSCGFFFPSVWFFFSEASLKVAPSPSLRCLLPMSTSTRHTQSDTSHTWKHADGPAAARCLARGRGWQHRRLREAGGRAGEGCSQPERALSRASLERGEHPQAPALRVGSSKPRDPMRRVV